jgi:hypothetical protein
MSWNDVYVWFPKPWSCEHNTRDAFWIRDADGRNVMSVPSQDLGDAVCNAVNGPSEPDPESLGETVVVRDFSGRLVDCFGLVHDGNFQTSVGIVEAGELGSHILRITGHPAAKKHPKSVG